MSNENTIAEGVLDTLINCEVERMSSWTIDRFVNEFAVINRCYATDMEHEEYKSLKLHHTQVQTAMHWLANYNASRLLPEVLHRLAKTAHNEAAGYGRYPR